MTDSVIKSMHHDHLGGLIICDPPFEPEKFPALAGECPNIIDRNRSSYSYFDRKILPAAVLKFKQDIGSEGIHIST